MIEGSKVTIPMKSTSVIKYSHFHGYPKDERFPLFIEGGSCEVLQIRSQSSIDNLDH